MVVLLHKDQLSPYIRALVYVEIAFLKYIFNFQALEDYLWQSSDLLDRLEDMR